MNKISLWFMTVTTAGLLAACGTTTDQQGAGETAQETASVEIVPSKASSSTEEIKVSSRAAPEQKKENTIAKIEEPIKELELEIEVPPASILQGKSPDEILAVFGEPVLLRKDEPAEVWQYLTDTCALHLIFYSKDGAEPKVTFVAMNDRNKALKIKSKACFKSQLKRVGAERAKALS